MINRAKRKFMKVGNGTNAANGKTNRGKNNCFGKIKDNDRYIKKISQYFSL